MTLHIVCSPGEVARLMRHPDWQCEDITLVAGQVGRIQGIDVHLMEKIPAFDEKEIVEVMQLGKKKPYFRQFETRGKYR